MKTLQFTSIIGCGLLLAGCQQNKPSGAPAPDFILSNMNGEIVTRSALKDKAVLISFWAVG
jgi:hypothetical protein